jgi:uncharacterized protein YacL (UPF0231 family)
MMAMMTIGCFFMTACAVDDNPAVGPDKPAVKDYSERLVPVIDPKGASHGTVMLRFYNDMPNVAYVSISNFQQMVYPGTTVQVVPIGEHQYALSNPNGTATVDTEKDIFESDDYEAFTNMMGQVQPGMPNTCYDALPIIRWKSIDIQPKNVHVALDYGKYGIDLRADDTGVYFPFATIADLYIDGYMHIADYNGQSVLIAPNGSYDLDDGYPKSFIAPILQETRTADMTDFSYRNLCFTLTNFFGYPGRTLLENKGLKEKGLDQALQDYGEAGQMTRTLLKSQNMYEYIAGTTTLGYLLFDGGHTYTDVTVLSPIDKESSFWNSMDQVKKEKRAEFLKMCPEYMPFENDREKNMMLRWDLNKKRTEKMGENVKYYKEGSTAYCWFNSFMCDNSGWRKFYKGEGPKPTVKDYPNDWLIALIDALEKAEADPEVKNFVLDISTNGGGSSDVVMFITSILCNKADIFYENTLTGQKIKSSYEVDRNLDGKFDEKDDQVKYNLNFALLTSTYSFSCGNLLPALLKDYGIPLLGIQSGGGSCCVLYNPSADGFAYRYSTHRGRLNDTKGQNIDAGIKPTYELETTDFFNIAKVTQLVESYYKSK